MWCLFERRFACADGFAAFGADVQVQQRTLDIRPVRQLQGAEAAVPDLRGGAALVIAALAARGRSRITDTGYIDRGYAGFAQMLAELGAQIEREMPCGSTSEKKNTFKKAKLTCIHGKKDDTIQLYKCKQDTFCALCTVLR